MGSKSKWVTRRAFYLVKIRHFSDKLVVTASEDGSVMFWDQREKSVSFTLEPYKHANINRPNFGHWIGSASINNEWVVAGGGPRFGTFSLA